MKIAFLVLAHRYPNQLIKLMDTLLLYNESEVYVHIDKKSEELYKVISNKFQNKPNVFLIHNRYSVYWGSYNQILATVSLIKQANLNSSSEYFCLLSGQDMPIKPIKNYAEFLKREQKEFVSWFKLPNNQWTGGGLIRLQHFSFDIPNHPYLSNKINVLISKLQNIFKLYRPLKYEYYGGSNWFNLSKGAVNYICEFLNNHPKYLQHFKHTRCADEIFIQTILLNSTFNLNVVS